ncbi:adenosine deaminase [soil metagenome]
MFIASRLALLSLSCLAALLAGGCAALSVDAPSPNPTARRPATAAEQRVARRFAGMRRDPPALRAFLRALPKGADLHTHLTGAVYAESYIRWAADMAVCVDRGTLAFVAGLANAAAAEPPTVPGATAATCRDPAAQRPASDALRDATLYRSLVDALSTRFWQAARNAGHYQFFDSFSKFGEVAREGRGAPGLVARSVAEVAERAALQNVLHLELMMAFGAASDEPPVIDPLRDGDGQFEAATALLLASGMRERVTERRQWLDGVETATRALLRCADADPMKGCAVSVRYIPYALRGQAPGRVFSQALFAFELAAADPRMAGVNLVMPEDWFIPMRDYDLHMRMYRFLRRQYPGVHVALHAGELALGLVPPEQLGLHVRQAIETGGAQRIGHGTDVMYDANPDLLLKEMARRRIAVEISLSSSDLILGVRGARHPLRQFLRAGVPVVIATDDEGVARSDLTNEYQRAVEEHGLGYRELKEISRNSIEYSFLPAVEKARTRARLEAAFTSFEAAYR